MRRKPNRTHTLVLLTFGPMMSCGAKVSTDNAGAPLNHSTGAATSVGASTSAGGASSVCTGSAATSSCGTGCVGNLEECNGCGLCVAKMVTIIATTNYEIDATEVTQGQYKSWLATNPPLPTSTEPPCGWKADPDGSLGETYAILGSIYDGADADHHPVFEVDWCDAYSYCKAMGKRLCGKIGGGTNAYADFADATKSEWYRACSSGGVNKYPYGATYDATYCDGEGDISNIAGTVPVGSLPHCQSTTSGFTGVYDLAGNVKEWEDSCVDGTEPTGVDATCHVRGGAYYSTSAELACDFSASAQRFEATYSIGGIRCCAD